MECARCQGIMVIDYFLDMEESGEIWMPGWRCVMCGEVIDPLILEHRYAQEHLHEWVSPAATPDAGDGSAPSTRRRSAKAKPRRRSRSYSRA